MASGYNVAGVDLDSIFKPRGASTARADVGYKVAGIDLAQRFYASTGAGDRIATDTGYKSGGTDLRQLFRDLAYVDDPLITMQPTSVVGAVGSSQTFTVAATGTAPLTYQWRKAGVDIAGETGASLTINPVALGDAGSYDCVVTSAVGTVTSNAVTLHVSPSVTSQPTGFTHTVGTGPYALQVTATGEGTLQFAWYKDGVLIAGPRNGNLSATQDQHVINPGALGDSGDYFCRVTNTYGTQDSDTVTVTFTDVAPVITGGNITGGDAHADYVDPSSGGGVYRFTVTASGLNLSYQWKKNGVNIPGATLDHYDVDRTDLANDADYTVVVSNSGGSDSATAHLYLDTTPPTITDDPDSFTAGDGTGPHALQCTATPGSVVALKFQWFKVGVGAVSGAPRAGNISATQDQHVFNPLVYADDGDYYCQVTTTIDSVDSATATVTVT